MKHVVVAAVLLVIELSLGFGIIAGGAMIIGLVVLLVERQRFAVRLRIALLYFCVSALAIAWLAYNVRLAKNRAIPVIAACRQFKAEHGRYPDQLGELIPAKLAALPHARNTLVGRSFGYDATRPALYFPAMFHGVLSYDLQTDSWTTNE